MVGMQDVAEQLDVMLARQRELVDRQKAGVGPKTRIYNHLVIAGPPGTGKTTVGHAVADAFALLGITGSTDVSELDASELRGVEYAGDAERITRQKIKDANQGVVLVDEAHQLADTKYGRSALQSMIKVMADPNNKTTFIFMGYPDKLKNLERVDPGFKSRVPLRLTFDRYSADDLIDITLQKVKRDNFSFKNKKAIEAMEQALEQVASLPEHASVRDAENVIRYADDARLRRVKDNPKMKLADRMVFVDADWKQAAERFLFDQEPEKVRS